MSLDGDYDDDNIFARIVRGEIPGATISEDDEILMLMDAYPQARGHALVISKIAKARNILDVEADVLSQIILAVQRLARAVRVALGPDGIRIVQFNGAPAGQSVFHLHFHVIPVWLDQAVAPHGGGGVELAQLQQQARLIAARLS